MLVRLTPRQRFEILVSQYEPQLRKAFLDAIDDIRSNIVLRRVVERLERGDINGAVRAMNLDEAAFRPLDEAIRQAFNGGGVAAVEQMPTLRDPEGHKVVVRWDARNLAAEEWLREHSTMLVSNIVEDQREAIRTALEDGLARGDNPTRTALDVVGRINRATGKREGGVIGLTTVQSEYVARARQELLSGEPDHLRHYLTRGRRDKRFDRAVIKSIESGKPLPVETVNRIVGRYSGGLLKLRGEFIARTETMTALNRAQIAAYEQAIAKGSVDESLVTKKWVATLDHRTRDTHKHLNGEEVGFRGRFQSISGATLEYPGDPSAPASERINCRCTMLLKIDFLRGIK